MTKPNSNAAPRNRIAFVLDQKGFIRAIAADEDIDFFIVTPELEDDHVYLWTSTRVGKPFVDELIEGWPVNTQYNMPM